MFLNIIFNTLFIIISITVILGCFYMLLRNGVVYRESRRLSGELFGKSYTTLRHYNFNRVTYNDMIWQLCTFHWHLDEEGRITKGRHR